MLDDLVLMVWGPSAHDRSAPLCICTVSPDLVGNLIEAVQRNLHPQSRTNLYAALFHYLQFTQEPVPGTQTHSGSDDV